MQKRYAILTVILLCFCMVNNVYAQSWQIVESWDGNIAVQAFNIVEEWKCYIRTPEFLLVESWLGYLGINFTTDPLNFTTVEVWSGEIVSYVFGFLTVESWVGSILVSELVYSFVESWMGYCLIPSLLVEDVSVSIPSFDVYLSNLFGIPLFAAQILLSGIVIFAFVGILAVFQKTIIPAVSTGLLALGFLVGLGWLPYWIILVLVMVLALLYSAKIRNWITGTGDAE